jgi:predicted metal-dependent peptidase
MDDHTFGDDVFGVSSSAAADDDVDVKESPPQEEDEDLYDDLKMQPAAPKRGNSTITTVDAQVLQKLQLQLKSVQQENTNLKRNISILYRTAKQEMQRKDRRIQHLEQQLQQQQQHSK